MSVPCQHCLSEATLSSVLTQGKLRCKVCGRIWGAMTEKELCEMEKLVSEADQAADVWGGLFGLYPRPSVVGRLVAEVRERRRADLRQYTQWTADSERNVTVDDVLREIKEKS